MRARPVAGLVFLALINSCFCNQPNLFSLDSSERLKEAEEGSCVNITCRVTSAVHAQNVYWFWMKDAEYVEADRDYVGTVIYSKDEKERPVSANFRDRVRYIGSPDADWRRRPSEARQKLCSVQICNLNRNDSGNYSFRFVNKDIEAQKWITKPSMKLIVVENPCLITFEKPSIATETESITLRCSTSTSCPSNLQIESSSRGEKTQLPPTTTSTDPLGRIKTAAVTFEASWQDDGRQFTCRTRNATDGHQRSVSLAVEYAPRDTVARVSSGTVKEGGGVTLTCSAEGRPPPTFSWFKDNERLTDGRQHVITSIVAAQSGAYHCEATNKFRGQASKSVNIEVTYPPDVEVEISARGRDEKVKEGERVTFHCKVKRSNPKPHVYAWYRDGKLQSWNQEDVSIVVQPESSGHYRCEARNAAGAGVSPEHLLQVYYKPKNTRICTPPVVNNWVRLGSDLALSCHTEAYPPAWFSWYRSGQTEPWRRTLLSDQQLLRLQSVQRADEGCYRCNATNEVDSGGVSAALCIRVLFPPSVPKLSLAAEVTEGQLVTVTCTTESFPPSRLVLTSAADRTVYSHENDNNSIEYSFTATSTHAGFYTCGAKNSVGQQQSLRSQLVVKYAPKEVRVKALPHLAVTEDTAFKLVCEADAHPPPTAVTWRKVSDDEESPVQSAHMALIVTSARPSDSGSYVCEARNEIGTGTSGPLEVQVQYAPRNTAVVRGEERPRPDGTTAVLLSCVALGHPPVRLYSWYRKTEDETEDEKVLDGQNVTVTSQNPGQYYCIADNHIGQRSSEPVSLFDGRITKALKFALLFGLFLIFLSIIFFWFRKRKNKPIQQTTSEPHLGLLGLWEESRSGHLMNGAPLMEPSRSREDLLAPHPPPDSRAVSSAPCVYSTVNLPKGQKERVERREGRTEDEALNYAALHFRNRKTNADEDVVYAAVSVPPPPAREEKHKQRRDYENVNVAHAAPPPRQYDTDTSEEEVEVQYSRVNFKSKSGPQGPNGDSEEESHYSKVKI